MPSKRTTIGLEPPSLATASRMPLATSTQVLVSDNVLQDGDIIESHYIVERRNRTIYKRMREYLYELTHSDELVTAVMPIGDGITVSTKI